MLQGSQRCIERVPDEVIDTLVGQIRKTIVSREQGAEQPLKDFAQRLSRRHLENRAMAVVVAARFSARLVQLRDDDFSAQVQQAQAEVASGEAALVNNQRQKELQDARILQAGENIHSAEAQIQAADAGVEAANSAIANARSAIEGSKADVDRTQLERRRQEALIATESATHQKLEQAVADQQRYQATLASREADLAAAMAQQPLADVVPLKANKAG